MANGDLVFPARGTPPLLVKGYFRDLGDKFVFHPITKPCTHRVIDKSYRQACGCVVERGLCKKFNTVDFSRCIDCADRENPNAGSSETGTA